MSYRKINVDGIEYSYIVGKVDTKIKTLGIFSNHSFGYVIDYDTTQVQPSHVRQLIQRITAQK